MSSKASFNGHQLHNPMKLKGKLAVPSCPRQPHAGARGQELLNQTAWV